MCSMEVVRNNFETINGKDYSSVDYHFYEALRTIGPTEDPGGLQLLLCFSALQLYQCIALPI